MLGLEHILLSLTRSHGSLEQLDRKLDRLDKKLDRLLVIGDTLMKADTQVLAFLEELNASTNKMAAAQLVQVEKITEIAKDIDELLAANPGLKADVLEQLADASAKLKSAAEFETAQAETLTQIAAKNDAVVPPVG